ncbi:PrsW family intramembrane metalloprotease [Aerosakkonemataceae cyanobacterium BLCC-F154]|uniref:PrsW family intramembrane metalloprotease n=1 Tax=Floridaenema fluviatile BLCC-F154 TaxID=3153640 RepID=A0ABV4YMM7_9CYAN
MSNSQPQPSPQQPLNLSDILPYQEAFNPKLYSQGLAKFLLFFALFPMVLSWLTNLTGVGGSLRQTAGFLGIYYACMWGVILHDLIKPYRFSWSNTITCVTFTALVGIPIDVLLQQIPPFNFLYGGIDRGGIPTLIGFVFGVGVLEEFVKALPVYLFLIRPGKVTDPYTAAFYGAMSGLGFAISEGVNYSMQYAMGLGEGITATFFGYAEPSNLLGEYLLVSTIRFICLPLFHAIWAGIFGYFLGLSAISNSRKTTIILIGWTIPAVLHGFYNTFAETAIGLLVMAFSILLFLTYLRNGQKMISQTLKQ